jgi:hypothetical protein
MKRPFPYTLEKYSTSSSRYHCPQCGKREFTRYVKNDGSRDHIADHVGKCSRADKCGHHYTPSQFFKENPNQKGGFKGIQHKIIHSPNIYLPNVYYQNANKDFERNSFVRFMMCHPKIGNVKAFEVLIQFDGHIGTNHDWKNGACVFWFTDADGRYCGGQVKLFDDKGHTVKYTDKEGNRKPFQTWIHKVLISECRRLDIAIPELLRRYDEYGAKSPCLFGLLQLRKEDSHKPIALVEAPKTAILMTVLQPQYIWLATGSLSQFTEDRMQIIKDRRVVCYPDLGEQREGGKTPYMRWYEKALELNMKGYQIKVSDLLENRCSHADREKGKDIADYLFDTQRTTNH